MNRRLSTVALAAAAIAALTLTGCSGTADAEERRSPLEEYFSGGSADLSQEEQEAKFAEQNAKVEERVAECMTEEGFEYVPNIDTGTIIYGDDTEWNPDDREWVAQYGYGMISSPMGEESSEPEQEYVDPNEDYVLSLSESEQNAYWEALYGPMPEEGEEAVEEMEYDWETSGCYGVAQHEIAGDDPWSDDAHADLLEAISELYTDMQDSPEMADIDAKWAACMDEAGYSGYRVQSDAQNEINEELNVIYEDAAEDFDPESAEVKALQEKEIETALADLECREKTDYYDAQADISYELEKQFIEDHKAELEAFKADIEQGQ